MRHDTINCSCGQQFYFESAATGGQRTVGFDEDSKPISQYFPPTVSCIKCDRVYDISTYPEKQEPAEEVEFTEVTEPPTEEGDGDGTDI